MHGMDSVNKKWPSKKTKTVDFRVYYQKMGTWKFWCMFWYGLKYLRRICVKIYMDALCIVCGSRVGSKIKPPHHISIKELLFFVLSDCFSNLKNYVAIVNWINNLNYFPWFSEGWTFFLYFFGAEMVKSKRMKQKFMWWLE